MFCFWRISRQVVHCELPPLSQTITANLYSQQLEHIQQALQQEPAMVNRKGLMFLDDNASPYVLSIVRDTTRRLG